MARSRRWVELMSIGTASEEESLGHKHPGRELWWPFSVHTMNICTQT